LNPQLAIQYKNKLYWFTFNDIPGSITKHASNLSLTFV